MSRQQELSYDEIAEELNISRNTVKNHLVSALKTLRTQLQKAFSILY
jgi:RNA polymerase sigma-70 factor (ECF subfamily)